MRILAFDPGASTGFAVLQDGKLAADVFPGWTRVEDLIDRTKPDVVVAEDFLLYPWRAKSLAWNDVFTARVLGVIQYLCEKRGIKFVLQSASLGKTISLRAIKGVDSKHGYDAIRHGIYYARVVGEGETYSRFQIRRRADFSPDTNDGLERPRKSSKGRRQRVQTRQRPGRTGTTPPARTVIRLPGGEARVR